MFYIEPKMDSKCMVVSTIADLEPYIIGVKNGESLSIDSLALAKDYDCFYIENPRLMEREATGAYHSYGAYGLYVMLL